MPALDQEVIDDLQARLTSFLDKKSGDYSAPEFVDAGGSAAVFKVTCNGEPRALKAFDPKFLSGPSGAAERRRMEVQRKLIGHDCPCLVRMFDIVEAEGTAFTEMEFLEWPQLGKSLVDVPDSQVTALIAQLVDAVRYLEVRNIVHRDIKPENIHISPDFKQLKLLDLGVAREIIIADGEDATLTDVGNRRPFVATAQYSSPEYLFRLDAPDGKLWKGLNIYQVGAVLHDLIMKRPLFAEEVAMDNRWLVARAVLTKSPSFAEPNVGRLAGLKALASRCLAKDVDVRLQTVDWNDFSFGHVVDPISRLKERLHKVTANVSGLAQQAYDAKLSVDKEAFERRFTESLRSGLIDACAGNVRVALRPPQPQGEQAYRFEFSISEAARVYCFVAIEWLSGLENRTANIRYWAFIADAQASMATVTCVPRVACTATIESTESEAEYTTSSALAAAFIAGLDLVESGADITVLHGKDLVA
ncbi:protein kinase domain-containing protein [Paraburkholderia sp. RL17-347-BIC-D]|uniref:protein kinase domain-containing protein n=1 Tax=Paraburkholderia sp. RL17-347-BIC-D TaxID=3031632 RepID=UPI0038BB1C49